MFYILTYFNDKANAHGLVLTALVWTR